MTFQYIFPVFFAVIYGAIFTISDRWRPFFTHFGRQTSKTRLVWSGVLLGILPIGYFSLMLWWKSSSTSAQWWVPLLSAYASAPIALFYWIFVWISIKWKFSLYSTGELACEPVKSSFEWMEGQVGISIFEICLCILFAGVLPVVLVGLLI